MKAQDRFGQDIHPGDAVVFEHEGHWFTGHVVEMEDPGPVIADAKGQQSQKAGQIQIVCEVVLPVHPQMPVIPSLIVAKATVPNPWVDTRKRPWEKQKAHKA